MARSPLKHAVFICGIGMTHIRPGVYFCARLAAKFPSLFISVYTAGPNAAQADEYLSTYHESVYDRIRIVPSVVDIPLVGLLDIIFSMERSFGPWISNMLASSSLEINGLVVEPPSYIIEDHINGGIALANVGKHGLPIASWWVANAISFLSHFGNKQYGDGGRLIDNMMEVLRSQESGEQQSHVEILNQVMTNRLVCIPGIPPHYETEQLTQRVDDMLPAFCQLRERWERMLEHTDTVVFTDLYEMESVAIEACADAFIKPVKAFAAGFAADLPQSDTPAHNPDTSDPALSFMNRAYTELGPNSVVYIAFGSLWFPSPESAVYLKTLLEEIVARGLRFVFSVKPEYAAIAGMDETYLEKFAKSGQGVVYGWVKQLEILDHPALHYFVSHGGWNSSTEAIARGVPMIFWPISADQPVNALHLAKQHDCAFELLQVRTGHAKSVAYGIDGDIPIVGTEEAVREEMRKILELSQGVRGTLQRQNVKALGKVARRAVAPGGSGDVALEQLAKLMGL